MLKKLYYFLFTEGPINPCQVVQSPPGRNLLRRQSHWKATVSGGAMNSQLMQTTSFERMVCGTFFSSKPQPSEMVLPPVSRSFLELPSPLQNLSHIFKLPISLSLSLASLCFLHLSHKPYRLYLGMQPISLILLLAWSSGTFTTFALSLQPHALIPLPPLFLSINISHHLFEEVKQRDKKEGQHMPNPYT